GHEVTGVTPDGGPGGRAEVRFSDGEREGAVGAEHVLVNASPQVLARLLGELSEADANVLAVNHTRTDPRLGVSEAEVELHLETQGPRHCAAVAAGMRDAGYRILD
ncbi:hypothetical protein K6C39_22290, partial [Vibrio vulnificus]|nr:hypothetical protein [Vibrio vulnificus]